MILRLSLDQPAAVENAIPGAEPTFSEKLVRGRDAMISRHTARWVDDVFVPCILPRAECGETDCMVRRGHLFVPIHDVRRVPGPGDIESPSFVQLGSLKGFKLRIIEHDLTGLSHGEFYW